MKKANTYLILFPPVSYTLSYLRCGRQVTTFYGLHGISYMYYRLQFLNPNNFFQYSSNLLDMRNLQEQVKKAFCYQKWF